MKSLLKYLVLAAAIASATASPFTNLDFQLVNTNTVISIAPGSPILIGQGKAIDLLPGWDLKTVGFLYNLINFNAYATGSGSVPEPGIFSKDSAEASADFLRGFFSGNYVFYVQTIPQPLFLSQTGDVPLNATELEIVAKKDNSTFLRTFLDGTEIFNGDISAFAGRHDVKLELEMGRAHAPSSFELPDIAIDRIVFIVPEPLFVENDFNGDGFPDVAFEHQDGFVGVWFMNKGPDLISASFFNPKDVDPHWHIVGTGSFVEFNTNKTDLLFQHEDGSLAVWVIHEGTNLFSHLLLNPSQPGEDWKVVGIGDMNHDGKKDIIFQHTDGTLAVWFMDGINLVQGALLNPNKPGDSGWRVVGTAALSSVGNSDLIFQHSDGTLAAWYMNGTNLVQGVLLNPSTPGEGWRVATTLDLNADGKTDLLFQHDDGSVAVWLMDGINLISGHLLNPETLSPGWRIAGPR